MTDEERAKTRRLYDLQLELVDIQGEEIAALHRANEALLRSHQKIVEMMKLTGQLMGVS